MEKTNLFKALANFQQNVPVIHKGASGYGYTYADLPAIFEVINPILKKNGLGFSQLLGTNDLGANTIETVIFHAETGESLSSTMIIPNDVTLKGMNEFQITDAQIARLNTTEAANYTRACNSGISADFHSWKSDSQASDGAAWS